MTRRQFLKRLGAGVAAACLQGLGAGTVPAAGTTGGTNRGPDILFIAIDDMNDWTTLFDPDNPIRTPNLERLAQRGVFFARAYCPAPACNPSRASIMTGYRPTTSGVYTNGQPFRKVIPDAVTMPQYFRRHGYSAKGAGKIFHHGGTPRGDDPSGNSFDAFFKLVHTRAPKPNYNGYTKKQERHLASVAWDWGEHTQKMIDIDTVAWIENVMEQTRDRPLFLAAGIFKPHLPFYAPPDVFERYPIDATRLPPMPPDDLDDVSDVAKRMAHREFFIYSNTTKQAPGSPGSLKRMVQCYQASADFADSMVGRLLDKLDATGRADNTIIVLWADHGYHLGDKESCVKFTLWEKANHVPFIIVAPGVTTPGTRCERPVGLVDIYPTLLELAGLPAKADLDGTSLVPLLKNPAATWARPAIMTMGRGNHAVRTQRWRYIRYQDGSEELYDHDKDPWEWTNLADDPNCADVIAQLKPYLPKDKPT